MIGTNIPHFIISRIRSWSSCQILLGIGSEKKGMPYYGAQIYVNGRLQTRYFPHLTWRGGAQTGFVIGGKIGWARLATYSIPGHHHLPPTWWPRWPPLVIRWPWLVRQKLWVGWECCTSCSSSPPWPSPPSCPSTWWGSTSWRPARASTTSCTRLGSAGSQGRSVSVKPESYHSSALPLYWVMFLRLDWCNPWQRSHHGVVDVVDGIYVGVSDQLDASLLAPWHLQQLALCTCCFRSLAGSIQRPPSRTWEETRWESTHRPRSSRAPSSLSSECLSKRWLLMGPTWRQLQPSQKTLLQKNRYCVVDAVQLIVNWNSSQKALDSSGVSRIETRVFREDGKQMELIHTIPGKPEIKSVRVYKKISD